jgi:hypothetical protein
MEQEHVSDAFIIHSLLLDHLSRNGIFQQDLPLSFPHGSVHQIDRFKTILQARNNRFSGYMRPEWNHICDLCSKVVERSDEKGVALYLFIILSISLCPVRIRSAVTDGITIGHPCCAFHDCKIPLSNMKHRYCDKHQEEFGQKCAVKTCKDSSPAGFRTCEAHRSIEISHFAKAKGMFQLRDRLSRQRQRGVQLNVDSKLASIDQGRCEGYSTIATNA